MQPNNIVIERTQTRAFSEVPRQGQAVVRFDNVSKSYGRHTALVNTSFTVTPGQVLAFIGPNGAGKTTLIEILMGLRKSDSGTVNVLGCDVNSNRSYLSKVGVQLQETRYYGKLCARDYIKLFSGIYPNCTSAHTLIAEFELEGFVDQSIDKLSGGQRQRVGLALALLHNPELVILDEPTVGLDPIARRSFWNTIRRVHDNGAKTVLFSTHYMEEAQALASSVMVIAAGRIVAAGTIAEVIAAAGGGATTLDDAYQILVQPTPGGEK